MLIISDQMYVVAFRKLKFAVWEREYSGMLNGNLDEMLKSIGNCYAS